MFHVLVHQYSTLDRTAHSSDSLQRLVAQMTHRYRQVSSTVGSVQIARDLCARHH